MLPYPVYFNKFNHNEKGEVVNEIEVCFQYNDSYNEIINSYANNINTEEGGTHLDGFKNALTKVINDYAVKNKIIKENEKLSGEDCREGITAVISVKLREPQFEGQTKTKLGNSEMRTIVYKAMQEAFGDYLEEHPTEARELIMKSITAQRARDAARLARESTRRKSVLENTTLPGKLADCSEKDSSLCEIYIVEGLHKILFAGVLAHEYLHVWQNERNIKLPSLYCEGFCNLGSYLVYRNISNELSHTLYVRMRDGNDPVYSEGFRQVKSVFDAQGGGDLMKTMNVLINKI